MEPGGSISSNLVDKIRNIDDSGLPTNKTMPPINEDASEIFGEPAAYVNVVEDNMVNQDTTTKSTAFTFSFANILNRNSNPNKKIVKLQELRNPERVDGAAVAIPMEAVEEFNTKEGMESGPWLVRGVPLILNIWNQNSELKKDAIKLSRINEKVNNEPINLKTNVPIPKKINVLNIPTQNSFGALTDDEEKGDMTTILNEDSDCEEVDAEMVFDDRNGQTFTTKGASTPVISENNLSVFAILESHVVKIILGWNHNEVDVTIINQNDQAVHSRLWLKKEKKEIFCTFVYAHNKYNQRRDLWNALCLHKVFVNNRPWCLLGDFNATLHLSESTASSSCIDIAMREFKDCVNNIEVLDVQNMGAILRGIQKSKGYGTGFLRSLTAVMANMTVVNGLALVRYAIFKTLTGDSDNSPSFKEVVNEAWNYHVSGFYMFRTVKKLKNLKKPLRKLMIDKGNLHANVERIRGELDTIQTQLDIDPFNIRLREIEAANVVAFNQAVLDEEMFLKQKAKISWLKDGDSNTAYFHKSVKSRVSRSRIDVISNSDGIIFANDKVPDAFVAHYEAFLGQTGYTNVDIQKAYDTVDWAFLNSVLMGFGFHERMIAWIMECVSSTSYSICINGNLHGYFQGKRGLRQGDPLSPYLFTLVMEECLDEFKHASGLIPSIPKSTAFFCNVLNHVKLSILNVLPFEEGRLPVKYLGVPLVSSRLKARDCKELVEKVQNRVLDWKNKALSIADEMEMQRLQKKARIMKDSCLNGISALKSRFTLLSKKYVPGFNESEFEHAFSHIFGEDVHKFTKTFSQNMTTLETQSTS
ncbi:sugar transport protein 13 [Tanacetum coccineum]|uniref:Sugar transport protein 13 n=1 Tax=Tanacetum coccineum TaxID=301880 RepID=A0ABQ5ADB3_9ASTR